MRLCVWPGSALPKHSCLVSEVRFSAAERQSVTLQYLWTVFRGWCWVLSFVLTSKHILAYITSVWQQALVCWVQSAPQGKVLVVNLMCQRKKNQCQFTRITNKDNSYLLNPGMQVFRVACAKLRGLCQREIRCQPITVQVCWVLLCPKQWEFAPKSFNDSWASQTVWIILVCRARQCVWWWYKSDICLHRNITDMLRKKNSKSN